MLGFCERGWVWEKAIKGYRRLEFGKKIKESDAEVTFFIPICAAKSAAWGLV